MNRTPNLRGNSGFSLLEVLVAVVLLATGLLALAALQSSLARNSADAKVRSRVIALLAADMDQQRSSAYGTVSSLGAPITAVNPDCSDLSVLNTVEVAACEAGVGNLTFNRTVTTYGGNAGGTAFAAGAPVAPNKAEFKRIEVTATWTDAGGQVHTANMRTVLSSLALDVNNPIVDNDSGNSPPPGPVVRQASPVTAGMIPIALGNGDSTAASNPTPELVGKNNNLTLVGTRFNVLTYTPTDNNLAIIQQRIETEVIKCKCQYGAGGSNLGEIYRTSQWPAVWTGKRYDVYMPDSLAPAPGQQYAAGPKAGVTQSALCQECCRDHHDNANDTTNARFDPEAPSSVYQKYDLNGSGNLVAVNNTTSADYVDACRIVRVDGLWRTAADLYSRQFGLLETETVSGVQAKTGLPTSTATASYTAFVKDYLKQYDGTTGNNPPSGAQALFDDPARGLNEPAEVAVATPSNSDRRYLHGRGLYVDHLETQARETLANSLAERIAKGECSGSALADCVLPFLPFTTINLTEIARWSESDATVLSVNKDGALGTVPDQPFGGRTLGIKVGVADAIATMRKSNSGVAVSTIIPGAVDLLGKATTPEVSDDATLSDKQAFNVGGSDTSIGDSFNVRVSGGPANYVVFYAIGADTNDCPGTVTERKCSTNSTFPATGDLRLGSYGAETTRATAFTIAGDGASTGTTCTNLESNKTFSGGTFTVDAPVFQNYQVASATVSQGSGTITSAMPAPADGTTDNTMAETTTISFANLAKDSLIDVGFQLQGSRTDATISACTVSKHGNDWVLTVTAWNRPWL